MASICSFLKKDKTFVTTRTTLYFHMFAFPVVTSTIGIGYELVEFLINPTSLLEKGPTYLCLLIACMISITLMIGSTRLLIHSINNKCIKNLNRFIGLQITFFYIHLLLNGSMDTHNGPKADKFRGLSYNIMQNMYMWHYIFYTANLLYFKEELKIYNGFPPTTHILDIHLEKLINLQSIIVGMINSGRMLSNLYFLLVKKEEQKFLLYLTEEIISVCHILSTFLLYIGGLKRNGNVILLYKWITVGLELPYSVFQVVWNHNTKFQLLNSRIVGRLAFSCGALFLIIELALFNLYIKRFKEPALDENVETVRTQDNKIKKFMKTLKSNKIHKLRVNIVASSERLLGEGQFCQVYKATVYDLNKKEVKKQVAVKLLKNLLFNGENLQSIMSEINIIQQIKTYHKNVVQFYGLTFISSGETRLGIVMEFCAKGSLNKYFQSRENDFQANSELNKIEKWSFEIASAMAYLHLQNIIHGDLAARNVLLDENETAKVADFGMSYQLKYYQLYTISDQAIFPWRWMAPESLSDLKFSRTSDVWSYGVILWELYSFGQVPWSGLEWDSNFVHKLQTGLRLRRPPYMSINTYESIILRCWETEELLRLDFEEILKYFVPV